MGIFIQEHAYSAVKKKKKNERIHDTQNNLNKSQNHDVASKKPDTEEDVLYVSMYLKLRHQQGQCLRLEIRAIRTLGRER